ELLNAKRGLKKKQNWKKKHRRKSPPVRFFRVSKQSSLCREGRAWSALYPPLSVTSTLGPHRAKGFFFFSQKWSPRRAGHRSKGGCNGPGQSLNPQTRWITFSCRRRLKNAYRNLCLACLRSFCGAQRIPSFIQHRLQNFQGLGSQRIHICTRYS